MNAITQTEAKAAPRASSPSSKVTPMMAQYLEIKAANADCLLFYRMGDFYELFFDDAVTASAALSITLTKRGQHQGQDIPMCGVPVHAADDYLQKLIKAGYRVAVCEQTEDPAEAKKRGAKSVVRREVKRLVTKGTITEDTILDAGQNNFLLAIAEDKSADGRFALAWCDVSTGEFQVLSVVAEALSVELSRIQPAEIIHPESLSGCRPLSLWAGDNQVAISIQPNHIFDSNAASDKLLSYFGVATLDGFSQFTRPEQATAAAIVGYLERTQIDVKAPLSPPKRQTVSAHMAIDSATRTNLELMRTLRGDWKGSLLHAIDRTITAPGRRRLTQDLMGPLTDPTAINARLDAVEFAVTQWSVRDELRDVLRQVPDIARALSRLGLERGGPRDLGAIRDALVAADALSKTMAQGDFGAVPLFSEVLSAQASISPDLKKQLEETLVDSLPLLNREGEFVKPGHSDELDEQRALRDNSRRVIADLQAKYAELTAVKGLKIRHNNMLGYFVEVNAQAGNSLLSEPFNQTFIHRQTMANAVRFTTVELGELESKIVQAGDRAVALELTIFEALRRACLEQSDGLKRLANAIAQMDVILSHASLASSEDYVRPKVDKSLAFSIEKGRHPVVEQALKADSGSAFVANDCVLASPSDPKADAGRLWLLTGPNMAGKSTFLRQNALIAILAQSGCFVPAASAHIGVVNRLFSRVGASDDLARGRSTFMVEMVETAAILNQADSRSLVILDEIGRGTATFDGLSIAWASVEYLHEANRCRALFATHFHELTALGGSLDRVRNATVKVKEWKGNVVFLHEVEMGAADRSYGIQVAKLAGLPDAVVTRARSVLDRLEAGERDRGPSAIIDDLPLFSVKPVVDSPAAADSVLDKAVLGLEPDHMSPREALDALYALKAMLKETP